MIRSLVCLFFLLGLASAQTNLTLLDTPQGGDNCPRLDGLGPPDTVDCDSTSTINTNCYDRCCKSTGVCFSSSCRSTFGLPDAMANCNPSCQLNVACVPYVSTCTDPHCLGFIHCLTQNCGGHSEGDICLYDGVSTNFKICTPSMVIVGDPQFVGLRGQSYQIHGVAGEIYNIVSDADLQYNSRFVFLDRGDCPVVGGKKQKGCFSHPGSYLGELGLKTSTGEKIHVVSGSAASGFASVELEGKPLEIGETILLQGEMGSVTRNSTHLVSVQVGNWDFAFENSDLFINQRIRVLASSKLKSHGLLGQTWRTQTYPNPIKYIQGEVDDYLIRAGGIFGDEFLYNAHN